MAKLFSKEIVLLEVLKVPKRSPICGADAVVPLYKQIV